MSICWKEQAIGGRDSGYVRERSGTDEADITGLAVGSEGAPLPCAITVTSGESRYVVRIHGAMNLTTEPFLRRRIRKAVAASGSRQFLLDMTYCEPLDATGLGLLVALDHELRTNGRRLILLRPSPFVRRILGITGVDQLLAVLR